MQDSNGITRTTTLGKFAAVVIANEPEDDGAHVGDLVVQVPGILEEAADGSGEVPLEVVARPCLPPGWFAVPDVGQRIWVEFANGDINEPIWTGVWFPAEPDDERAGVPDTPDDEAPTEAHKVWRTRGGNVLLFDDSDDAQRAVLKIANDEAHCTLTLDQAGIRLENDSERTIVLCDGRTNRVTLDGDGITMSALDGASTVELKSDAIVMTVGGSSIEIKDGKITITAAKVDVESG